MKKFHFSKLFPDGVRSILRSFYSFYFVPLLLSSFFHIRTICTQIDNRKGSLKEVQVKNGQSEDWSVEKLGENFPVFLLNAESIYRLDEC